LPRSLRFYGNLCATDAKHGGCWLVNTGWTGAALPEPVKDAIRQTRENC